MDIFLCFVAVKLYCHVQKSEMYGIVKRRLLPRPSAVSHNVCEKETNFQK